MKVEFEVSDAKVTEAAKAVLDAAFKRDNYGGGGPAFELVKAQTHEEIKKIDARPIIKALLAERLETAIGEYLDEEIAKRVRKTLKAMESEGTMFAQQKEGKAVEP